MATSSNFHLSALSVCRLRVSTLSVRCGKRASRPVRGMRQVVSACKREKSQSHSSQKLRDVDECVTKRIEGSALATLVALSLAIDVWNSDGKPLGLGKRAEAHAEVTEAITMQEKREQMRLKRLAEVEKEKQRLAEKKQEAQAAKEREMEKKIEEEKQQAAQEAKEREIEKKKIEEEKQQEAEAASQERMAEEPPKQVKTAEETPAEESTSEEPPAESVDTKPFTSASSTEEAKVPSEEKSEAQKTEDTSAPAKTVVSGRQETTGAKTVGPPSIKSIDPQALQRELNEKTTKALDSFKSSIPKISFGNRDKSESAKDGYSDKNTASKPAPPPTPKSEFVLSIRKKLTDFVSVFAFIAKAIGFIFRIFGQALFYASQLLIAFSKVLTNLFT